MLFSIIGNQKNREVRGTNQVIMWGEKNKAKYKDDNGQLINYIMCVVFSTRKQKHVLKQHRIIEAIKLMVKVYA